MISSNFDWEEANAQLVYWHSTRREQTMTDTKPQYQSDQDFKRALASVINAHSRENRSDTPDYILADYLYNCLIAFEKTTKYSNAWHKPRGETVSIPIHGPINSRTCEEGISVIRSDSMSVDEAKKIAGSNRGKTINIVEWGPEGTHPDNATGKID